MSYIIIYHEKVIKKHIPSLAPSVKAQIKKAIELKLTVDPLTFGKPLQYSFVGHRSLRVGDWRVIYRIEEKNVKILAIQHRSIVYDQDA